ncbi:MAG: glycine cleavage system protein GcvH [Paludibacter sp.]|nr:glycine cleavage system protein GcvH [Paludibacter sp.]
MNLPENLKYTKNHEWLRVEGNHAFVGITDFAQSELGEIVFVEVETIGETLAAEEAFGSVEAVKTVSELLMPVDGDIVNFNSDLEDFPEFINDDPYGKGWIIEIVVTNPAQIDELLSAESYNALVG